MCLRSLTASWLTSLTSRHMSLETSAVAARPCLIAFNASVPEDAAMPLPSLVSAMRCRVAGPVMDPAELGWAALGTEAAAPRASEAPALVWLSFSPPPPPRAPNQPRCCASRLRFSLIFLASCEVSCKPSRTPLEISRTSLATSLASSKNAFRAWTPNLLAFLPSAEAELHREDARRDRPLALSVSLSCARVKICTSCSFA
mmetsp:Transcript_103651/g.288547  ORF Transcript_103651/g.288547 Transcript_103651/m.288547 type:complete len:201 (+) Transcript_103651:296-898(+)